MSARLVVAMACSSACAAEPQRNVLLITLDTTRADRLGCYGHARARTPSLDRLAAEGVRFDEAITTNGLTPMAHASILTGVNPYRHDLRVFYGDAGRRVAPDVPVLAEVLAGAGYATAAFVSAYPVSEAYGFERGFASFDSGIDLAAIDVSRHMEHEKLWVDARASQNQRRSDATIDAALQWLDRRPAGAPWFLWVHFFDAHDFALVPPVEFAAELGADYRRPPPFTNNAARRDWIYDAEVAFMDAQLGRLLAAIERRDEIDSTVIAAIGDHGQGLVDGFERHGWMLHTLPYQWCLRVPLIVRLPAQAPEGRLPAQAFGADAPRGRVVTDLVRSIDVFPTILEAVGLAAPAPIEGESLLPLARGEPQEPRIAYADALTLTDRHAGDVPQRLHDDLFCAMDHRFKLVWHRGAPAKSELFDLDSDPLELTSVAADHQDVVAQMYGWLERRGAFELRRPEGGAEDPRQRALLEALGYGGDGKKDE